MADAIRIGVIGVGHLGRHHARLAAQIPGARLTHVVDTDADRARVSAEATGAAPLTDYRDLVGEVDAV
ncbi:MAG TPA: Gfo/Idh/MocA family oxidoreductase, partial [Vicinamibacterales bacterium]|nr:Gfo/Idh/MocA family oxidoreductase [Vicinamibacterales bacterium]